MPPAVQLDRVSRIYGTFAALRNVSLTLDRGSAAMLLGENGAGKSTLLRIVAGLIRPTVGSVRVFGEESSESIARLSYMSHATLLYDELTALENLRYFAATLAGQTTLRPEDALERVGLSPTLPQRLSEYSQGMRQRAALARALLSNPDLLLLDEPFSNLDAASSRSMVALLQDFLAQPSQDGEPRTLLLTTHQPDLAAPLVDRTIRLERGALAPEKNAATRSGVPA